MTPVNLAGKLAQVTSHRDPHVLADYYDNDVMMGRVKGAFPLHLHETTDDFFLVLEGEMTMDLQESAQILRAAELFVLPKGITHRPRAETECQGLLIEPKGAPNTGDPATAASKNRI